MDAKLIVVGGDAVAAQYELTLPAVIGRSRSASIKVPQALVSRRHCELYEEQGRLVVRDLGSLNGTFIGSDRITEDTVLPPGGLLTIGSITFKAEYVGPDEEDDNTVDMGQTVEIARGASKASAVVQADRGTGAFDELPLDFGDVSEEAAAGEPAAEAFPWLQDEAQVAAAHDEAGVPDELELDLPGEDIPAPAEAAGADYLGFAPPGDLETVPLEVEKQDEDSGREFVPPAANADDAVSPDHQQSGGKDDDLDDFFRSLDIK